MHLSPQHRTLLTLNATVLLTHQIDAAYWHEWEMFRIPGGNQVNLLLNLPIVAFVLWVQAQVAAESRRARTLYLCVAALGGLTVVIHGGFMAMGHAAFVQPTSIGLLVATLLLSLGQGWALWGRGRPRSW